MWQRVVAAGVLAGVLAVPGGANAHGLPAMCTKGVFPRQVARTLTTADRPALERNPAAYAGGTNRVGRYVCMTGIFLGANIVSGFPVWIIAPSPRNTFLGNALAFTVLAGTPPPQPGEAVTFHGLVDAMGPVAYYTPMGSEYVMPFVFGLAHRVWPCAKVFPKAECTAAGAA